MRRLTQRLTAVLTRRVDLRPTRRINPRPTTFLTRLTRRTHRDERGAVSVIVAVAMVALLGFVAITVDVGAIYAERAQLQNGADATALAIAQQCAAAPTACTSTSTTRVDMARATAQAFANANSNDGESNVAALVFPTDTSIRVTTSTRDADTNAGSLAHAFAPVLGIDTTTVSAQATVAWGSPSAGPAILPLAFAPCSFRLEGPIQVLSMHGDSGGASCSSTSPSGQLLPGGFGWLNDPTGTCTVNVDIAIRAPMSSDTGVSLPANCAAVLDRHKNQTLLVPVYGDKSGTGNGGTYRITGWAAFTLLGWNFPGYSYNNKTYSGATCQGTCKGLIGRFVRFVTLDDRFSTTATAPSLGTNLVTLRN